MNRLLHNMSTPPKSVIRYEGSNRFKNAKAALKTASDTGCTLLLKVTVPEPLRSSSVRILCSALTGIHSKAALLGAIVERSRELPFPDVLPLAGKDAEAFDLRGLDELAILSLATQSSGFAWFRNRTPDLLRLPTLESLTLCVRPSTIPSFSERFVSHDRNVVDFQNP